MPLLFNGQVSIDDFRETSDVYLLTHWHADHTKGLRRGFAGDVWCSAHTGRLLLEKHPSARVRVLRRGVRVEIAPGIFLVPIDSNHMPGSFALYFPAPHSHLYCGDFRLSEQFLDHVQLLGIPGNGLKKLWLDGTFNNQKCRFLKPEDSLKLFKKWMWENKEEQHVYVGLHHAGTAMLLVEAGLKFGIHPSVNQRLKNALTSNYPAHVSTSSSERIVVVKPTPEVCSQVWPILVPCSLYYACKDRHTLADRASVDERGCTRINYATHSDYVDNLRLIEVLRPDDIGVVGDTRTALPCILK